MRTIKDLWFNRPAFNHVNSNSTPEKNETAELATESSPLTEPPSSFVFDQISPESEQDAEAHLNAALYLSTQDTLLQPPTLHQSFQSIESATGGSSLNESLSGSQRIIKDGREIVISSDGEDTDSICSLEDPKNLFAPKSKMDESTPAKFTTKISSPKKYRHTIDSLVHDAVDDNEVEASVARVRANYVQGQLNGKDPGNDPSGTALNETMLISALGENEDGVGGQRLISAIRRTDALDHGRAWPFFDCTQTLPPVPPFPRDLFAPGTSMDILRGELQMSRCLLYYMLTDLQNPTLASVSSCQANLFRWLYPKDFCRTNSFCGCFVPVRLLHLLLIGTKLTCLPVPYERREELSNAYYGIIKVCKCSYIELQVVFTN
jgi:hypothetical protein